MEKSVPDKFPSQYSFWQNVKNLLLQYTALYSPWQVPEPA